jgi:hypothetical protein
MSDQSIDALMARAIQADAVRTPIGGVDRHAGSTGVPGRLRGAAGDRCPYVLVGHTLAEVHASLPHGLERSDRQPSDPSEVVEAWFPA